jgi:hypothetical protein
MFAFTFDFDLEDDLDESFDAIPLQGSAALSSVDKTSTPEHASGAEITAEEIPLSALVSPITIYHSLFLAASIILRVLTYRRPIGSAARRAPRCALILASDSPGTWI